MDIYTFEREFYYICHIRRDTPLVARSMLIALEAKWCDENGADLPYDVIDPHRFERGTKQPPQIKCRFCEWSTWKGFKIKDINKAHDRLYDHIEDKHPGEYDRIRSLLSEKEEGDLQWESTEFRNIGLDG